MSLFLHGWGKTKDDYKELLKLTDARFVDLPGFELVLSRPFDLDDYCQWLDREIKGKVVLITHSFGGRVAIKFAVAHPEKVEKLVLIASGGIERKSLRIKLINLIKSVTPGRLRSIFRPIVGSEDYNNANGYLRETLKNIVAENLEFVLPQIKVPTLIIWGDKDHTTPLWQGRLMHKLIPNSRMVIIHDGNHGIPYRRTREVADLICKFL